MQRWRQSTSLEDEPGGRANSRLAPAFEFRWYRPTEPRGGLEIPLICKRLEPRDVGIEGLGSLEIADEQNCMIER